MSERLLGEDCFVKAAKFIGEDWLNEQIEKHRDSDSHKTPPQLVQNYRRARKELGYVEDEFASKFPTMSMPTAEFINLGRYVTLLEDSDAIVVHPETFDVLDVTLAEHFVDGLRNPRHYERTHYELQTGYFYDRRGYTVQFLNEDKSDSKTPDILLRTPFKVFVECKRVDAVSDSVQKAKSIASELNKRTVRHLDPHHVAVFEYSYQPEMRDIAKVTGVIPSSTHNGPVSVELPFGTVTVYNLEEMFGEHGMWVVDSGNGIRSNHEAVYETYLQPLVKSVLGEKLTLSDIEFTTKAESLEYPARTEYADLRFSCVPTRFERNRVSRVAGQVDKARKKFGEEYPNILHIDMSFRTETAEEIVDDLREALGKRLGSTRRVTAVTVSLPVKEIGDAGAEAIRHKGISIKHIDPYADLPKKFEVLGADIS